MSIFLKKSYAHNRKQKKTETRALCSKSLFYDFRKSLSVLFDFWTFYKCPKTLFIDSPFWNFLFFSRSTSPPPPPPPNIRKDMQSHYCGTNSNRPSKAIAKLLLTSHSLAHSFRPK